MDGERVLGHGENGSIKRLRVGAEAAEANLRALLTEIYSQAGIKSVAAASVGVASANQPGTEEWITAVLNDYGAGKTEVVGDEVIALDAAFQGGPGILQIAGTGSNCIGRTADGRRECAGGYSSRLGDEGSGYWIGLHAVIIALHAYDRDEPTQILDKVGEVWGTANLEDSCRLRQPDAGARLFGAGSSGARPGGCRRRGGHGSAGAGRSGSGGLCAAGPLHSRPSAELPARFRGVDRWRD